MKLLKKTLRQLIQEAIALDIEKGDVILTGRFKNKRRIVKSIGTDKWGQPTINGKSILKFKIEKNMPKNKWSAKSREELKESPKRKKMKLLRETIRDLLAEIVQIPVPDSRTRVVHNVEEEVTEEMLEDMISVLPLWEAGEHEQVATLLQDMHSLGRRQVHAYMEEAEEMKNYGQINGNVPEWVTDYFYDKFSEEW